MKRVLVVAVAVVVGAVIGGASVGLVTAAPQAGLERYDYLHIFGMVGDCRALASGSTLRGAPTPGVSVLDLRTGYAWCLPQDGGAAIFVSRLNLAGIPMQAPTQ
jgi:hypothetical protein